MYQTLDPSKHIGVTPEYAATQAEAKREQGRQQKLQEAEDNVWVNEQMNPSETQEAGPIVNNSDQVRQPVTPTAYEARGGTGTPPPGWNPASTMPQNTPPVMVQAPAPAPAAPAPAALTPPPPAPAAPPVIPAASPATPAPQAPSNYEQLGAGVEAAQKPPTDYEQIGAQTGPAMGNPQGGAAVTPTPVDTTVDGSIYGNYPTQPGTPGYQQAQAPQAPQQQGQNPLSASITGPTGVRHSNTQGGDVNIPQHEYGKNLYNTENLAAQNANDVLIPPYQTPPIQPPHYDPNSNWQDRQPPTQQQLSQRPWDVNANWGEINRSFALETMNVYSDILKGRTPHEVGHFVSQVFLKMNR